MEKKNSLILNQETIKLLNEGDQHNSGQRYISQACNTQFLSCPECNPGQARER